MSIRFLNNRSIHNIEETELVGYTLLNYIESTGTQYIDTGYTPNADDIFKVTVKDVITFDTPIFGATSKWKAGSILLSLWKQSEADNYNYTWWYSNVLSDIKRYVSDILDIKLEIELNKGNVKVYDTVTIEDDSTNTDLVIDDTLKIFGGIVDKYSSFKLYGFKVISKEGILLLDLVPVQRKEDSILGLFDKIKKVFYINAGSGEFISGGEANNEY